MASGHKPYNNNLGQLYYNPTQGETGMNDVWMSKINTSRTTRTQTATFSTQGSYQGITPKQLSITLNASDLILKLDNVKVRTLTFDRDLEIDTNITSQENTRETSWYVVNLRSGDSGGQGSIQFLTNGNVLDVRERREYPTGGAVDIDDKTGISFSSSYKMPTVAGAGNNWIPGVQIEQYPATDVPKWTYTYNVSNVNYDSIAKNFKFDEITVSSGEVTNIQFDPNGNTDLIPFYMYNNDGLGDYGELQGLVCVNIPFIVKDISSDATKTSVIQITTAVIKDFEQNGSVYEGTRNTEYNYKRLNVLFVVDDSVVLFGINPNSLSFGNDGQSGNAGYTPQVHVNTNVPWQVQ